MATRKKAAETATIATGAKGIAPVDTTTPETPAAQAVSAVPVVEKIVVDPSMGNEDEGVKGSEHVNASTDVHFIGTLARAHMLPFVHASAETRAASLREDSVSVFRGNDGTTMEIVLAKPEDVAHQPNGLDITDSTGLVLAAQPLEVE